MGVELVVGGRLGEQMMDVGTGKAECGGGNDGVKERKTFVGSGGRRWSDEIGSRGRRGRNGGRGD